MDHSIYKKNLRNLQRCRLQWLLNDIDSFQGCPGVVQPELQKFGQLPTTRSIVPFYLHLRSMPQYSDKCGAAETVDELSDDERYSCHVVTNVRSSACNLLVHNEGPCVNCTGIEKSFHQRMRKEQETIKKPISMKEPLHKVAKSKLVKAIKIAREKEKSLNQEILSLKEQIHQDGVFLEKEVHEDFRGIIEGKVDEMEEGSFEKLFLKQQVESFRCNPSSFRWHPMMIRFALHLHLRSPFAYNALRESKVVRLPCERTLRDYSNVIHPEAGFSKEVLDDLKKDVAKLQHDMQHYVALLFDEVSIKDDLVYDSTTGELIGFINLGDNVDEFIDSFMKGELSSCVATHALVFMIVGLASDLKQTIGYFGTRGATADILYPLIWKAIGYLEVYVRLKVILMVSDKASPNQRFYRIHKNDKDPAVYRAIDIFAPGEHRYVFLFSDAPHLLKTIRNNLANSGSGLKTRYLWNNEKHLLWSHIVKCYLQDSHGKLRKLPKITRDHIYLNSYSKMRVNLAAQVKQCQML